MRLLSFGLFLVAFCVSSADADIVLFSEDFDGQTYPDQAPLVAADGDASTSFAANTRIGDTNAAGDSASGGIYSSAGSDLWTRNGTRAYVTTPNASFANGSGNVGQLHSHTSGGFMLVSVGPLVSNVPTPIAVTANEGDIFRMTFDMYVQELTTVSSNLDVFWNTNSANNPSQTWDAYTTASVGDNLSVVIEFTVAANQTDITEIAPQFQLSQNAGQTPFNTAFAQIDNFVFSQITAVPEPSSLLVGMMFVLAASTRRKRS